jgi:hypothetical protein
VVVAAPVNFRWALLWVVILGLAAWGTSCETVHGRTRGGHVEIQKRSCPSCPSMSDSAKVTHRFRIG